MAVAFATGLILLAGCTGQNPSPAPTSPEPTRTAAPSATPTSEAPVASASPTPSPTPTADAAPVYSPDDFASWTIDFTGVGPLLLGTPVEEAAAVVTLPSESCRPGVVSYLGFSAAGVSPDAGAPMESVLVMYSPDAVDRGEVTAWPATEEGITIGSTIDEVLAAYPDAVGYQTAYDTTVYSITDGSVFIHFDDYGQGTLQSIVVSIYDQRPKEFCG